MHCSLLHQVCEGARAILRVRLRQIIGEDRFHGNANQGDRLPGLRTGLARHARGWRLNPDIYFDPLSRLGGAGRLCGLRPAPPLKCMRPRTEPRGSRTHLANALGVRKHHLNALETEGAPPLTDQK